MCSDFDKEREEIEETKKQNIKERKMEGIWEGKDTFRNLEWVSEMRILHENL